MSKKSGAKKSFYERVILGNKANTGGSGESKPDSGKDKNLTASSPSSGSSRIDDN